MLVIDIDSAEEPRIITTLDDVIGMLSNRFQGTAPSRWAIEDAIEMAEALYDSLERGSDSAEAEYQRILDMLKQHLADWPEDEPTACVTEAPPVDTDPQ